MKQIYKVNTFNILKRLNSVHVFADVILANATLLVQKVNLTLV